MAVKTKEGSADQDVTIEECGCCCMYHKVGYTGDCRNDAERFYSIPDARRKLKTKEVRIVNLWEPGSADQNGGSVK